MFSIILCNSVILLSLIFAFNHIKLKNRANYAEKSVKNTNIPLKKGEINLNKGVFIIK